MAAEAGETQKEYFYYPTCPMNADCSEKSFKNAGCWGWTRQEAQARLQHHLEKSVYHMLPITDAEVLASLADVESDTYEAPPVGQPSKRKRAVDGPMPTEPTTGVDYREVIANAIQHLQAAGSGQVSSSSAPPVANITSDLPLVAKARPSSKMAGVFVSIEEAKACHDSMVRAHRAVKSAQKLCTALGQALNEEAEVIHEAKNNIELLVRGASR